jgi:curved DNA-binding protein
VGEWLLGRGETQSAAATTADVTQPLELSPSEALQGGSRKVVIRTNEMVEQVLLTIPPGIKSGARLRLKGKGRPSPDGSRGDLYLLVNVT